jgi:hypothetical protein
MQVLSLKVDPMPGSDIAEACEELCILASRLGCIVEMKFNDVHVAAKPGADPIDLRQQWGEASNSKSAFKFICGQPVQVPRWPEAIKRSEPSQKKTGADHG